MLRSPNTSPYDDTLAPTPGLRELDGLLDASRSVGLSVTRHDAGDARPLSDAAERAAHRVVQEALTNVHKHVGGATAEVDVRFLADTLEVTVRNTAPPGRAPDEGALPGSGLGLVGLRERLALMGGRLHAGPDPDGGFTVRARIPAAPLREPR
ncbi:MULTISPECIES: sensor histidine kinase [Streptomyces]|uniref:sensor histidine kinase n=1 Tax=Streptomyces lycopersici TaxID=2974589 RepID=UPI0021CF454E|nr:ATP-binding protein [Streptomyces sp. NEAU-383]